MVPVYHMHYSVLHYCYWGKTSHNVCQHIGIYILYVYSVYIYTVI